MEQAQRPDDERAGEVLRYLADIWEEEPLAVGLLLLRCRHPRASMRALARKLGIDQAAGGWRLWNQLARYSAALASFARGAGKVHGRQGGKKKAPR